MPAPGATDAEVVERFIPALASLLAVAIDRESLEREALETEALRRSDAIKTTVLRAVSHDLRSPLTAIVAAAGGLENRELELDESDRAALTETILIEAARLEEMVRDLLDLSRLEAGASDPQRELWSVDELVGGALDEVRDDGGVSVDVSPELPPVEVDAAHARRILVNLLAQRPSSRRPHGSRSRHRGAGRRRCRDSGCRRRPGDPGRRPRVGLPALLARQRGRLHGPRSRDRTRLCGGERRQFAGRARRGRCRTRPHAANPTTRVEPSLSASAHRILVVDDEPQILRALRTNLRGAGYDVVTAETAEAALAEAAMRAPDAVILDLLLPDARGTDVCRELRRWSTVPIIVLSAVGDEKEKVAALDAGADDYLTKPFGIDELLARLRAALRRVAQPAEPVVEIGDLRVDLERRAAFVGGEPVQLTPHEYGMLALFARNPGKLLTHRTILQEVWGPGYGEESHYLHVYVSQLRRKIETDPTRPRYLITEPGAGYRFVDPS